MLELHQITKSYRTKSFVQDALKNVSIQFRQNEFTAILGASGSGKTTMLNIIGGLDRYDQGDLLIDGVSTKRYHDQDWDAYRNNRIGFVFQSYNLINHQTVLANVELALTLSGVNRKTRRERALTALTAVGLIDHINKLPTQLSGGQMQRVAIARALINDPEILLADEPTGALDSSTSQQVMELLAKIASDRLVIMVTHNAELAHDYANRIIELKDGEVIKDSRPLAKEELNQGVFSKLQRTSMSLLTALSLSLSNLKTKSTRTIITALAGSIGIIGIASILALASGINDYIRNIEKETMNAYPVTINATGIDLTSLMDSRTGGSDLSSQAELPVINSLSNIFSHQNQNDLASLKAYLDKNKADFEPYVKSIEYKYSLTPQIYLPTVDYAVQQVNPDQIFKQTGIGSTGGLELFAGGSEMGMSSFNALPAEASLYLDQYQVVAGRWPNNPYEIVVVLSNRGSISDLTAYALGLKDRLALLKQFESLKGEAPVLNNDQNDQSFNYADALAVRFKVVQPAKLYVYDTIYQLWVDKSSDFKFRQAIIDESPDLTVVGIVQASDTSKAPLLTSGLYYPAELITNLMNEAKTFQVVQDQLAKPELNVFTNQAFSLPSKPELNLSELISFDQNKLFSAITFQTGNLGALLSGFEFDFSTIELPPLDLSEITTSLAEQLDLPWAELSQVLNELLMDFVAEQEAAGVTDINDWLNNLTAYLNSPAFQSALGLKLTELGFTDQIQVEIQALLTNYLNEYIASVGNSLLTTLQKSLLDQLSSKLTPATLAQLVKINPAVLAQAFQFKLTENDLMLLLKSYGETTTVNQSSNLKLLGYRDSAEPTQINLYPRDFTTKDQVIALLEAYNTQMSNSDQPEKMVKYTDFIGALLSSVTEIISTISYALIAFVSISLIVSSIMIGVITYVSVLERIKEIGILRALGARKKDIRRVFNAETLLVGLLAGSFGVGITYGLALIANRVVYRIFKIANIAQLSFTATIILVLISMFLAYISGLIPASKAAKMDPVAALRTE